MGVLSETVVEYVCLDEVQNAEEQIDGECDIIDGVKSSCGFVGACLGIVRRPHPNVQIGGRGRDPRRSDEW